jgi:hypothetical protein
MLKKSITYEDFNGEKVTEDFFFHLSKAELVELELSHKGGLSESLQRIVEAEDGKGIIAEFKNIILTAYGQRSEDGKRFIKNTQLREEFESTEAYSELFIELVTDTDAAIEFINGVIPSGMVEEAQRVAAVDLKPVPEQVTIVESDEEPQLVTRADLISMSHDELAALPDRIAAGHAVLEAPEEPSPGLKTH